MATSGFSALPEGTATSLLQTPGSATRGKEGIRKIKKRWREGGRGGIDGKGRSLLINFKHELTHARTHIVFQGVCY